MDEMKTLQSFRADAPPPDRARLAPGRQRLLDAAARRGPSRRDRLRWKIVAPAAAAAVTALVVLGVQTWPGDTRDESGVASDVSFLEAAARSIEKTGAGEPAPRLGPDQWAYAITADLWRLEPGKKPVPPTPKECAVEIPGLDLSVVTPEVNEFWRRGDGLKGAGTSHGSGKCGKMNAFNMSAGPYPRFGRPIGYYYSFTAKSHTPERLVDDMRAAGIGSDIDGHDEAAAGDFRMLVGLFHMPLKTSPEFTATVYRAMARIPGVTVTQQHDEAYGRSVVVVTRDGPKGKRQGRAELIMDPKSYRVLGMRARADFSLSKGKHTVKPGDLLYDRALIAVGITDKLGDWR